jgi:hypothetical protein
MLANTAGVLCGVALAAVINAVHKRGRKDFEHC